MTTLVIGIRYIAGGKPTLPLINALDRGTPEQQNTLREAIENGGLDYID